jgi:hypothetical protein
VRKFTPWRIKKSGGRAPCIPDLSTTGKWVLWALPSPFNIPGMASQCVLVSLVILDGHQSRSVKYKEINSHFCQESDLDVRNISRRRLYWLSHRIWTTFEGNYRHSPQSNHFHYRWQNSPSQLRCGPEGEAPYMEHWQPKKAVRSILCLLLLWVGLVIVWKRCGKAVISRNISISQSSCVWGRKLTSRETGKLR